MAHRYLKYLSIVTHSVERLDVAVNAWCDYLNYQVVDSGNLGRELCAVWDTPLAQGSPFCLLQAASREPVYIRFVENRLPNGYTQPATYGWCATELLVKDPDQLLMRLRNSPFAHIAGPMDLFPQQKAPRALQMMGPSGELIYFTRILPGGSRYGMKPARSEVDRPFITPVGGPLMADLQNFYGDTLGLRTMPPIPFVNGIMAAACGVDEQTPFAMAIAPLPGRRFLIELDELPAGIGSRPRPDGKLPLGMAMVSFETPSLDGFPVEFRARPRPLAEEPYAGRRAAVIQGPAGEWLELIQTP